MKLLVVTQTVDSTDPVLGFFHGWILALAQRVESVEVICLFEGEHELPANVRVHSLGKEKEKQSPIVYATRFFALAWNLRDQYDRVFVHMNQEYLLIAGWLWALLRKPAYLWRNHYAGSWLTDCAALFCTKVFCTSKHSYTATYKKTKLMPVGVDLERFVPEVQNDMRTRSSILFLARMAPSKRPDLAIEALGLLKTRDVHFTATFIGSPLPEDEEWYAALKQQATELGVNEGVLFQPGIPNARTPEAYHSHELFVNASRSGMFDKTLFEAAASGCIVLASSEDFEAAAGETFHFTSAAELAERIERIFQESADDRARMAERMQALARAESLATLCDSLVRELYSANI